MRAICLLALLGAAPAAAEEAVWLAAIAQGPVQGRLLAWLEVQPRLAGTVDNLLLRPALGIQLSPGVQLLAGYQLQLNDPEIGPTVTEHRLWQQVSVRLAGQPGRALIASRTRLEQRFVEGESDEAMRLRQLVRGQLWLDGRWSLIGTGEAFIGLEATPWGQRRGLEQFRTFVGVGRALSPRLTLEAGYLNQRFVRPGRDRANDVLSLNLFYRLG